MPLVVMVLIHIGSSTLSGNRVEDWPVAIVGRFAR